MRISILFFLFFPPLLCCLFFSDLHFTWFVHKNVYFIKNISSDVSREFDEFQVNTHLCKLRCVRTCNVLDYMGEFLLLGVLFLVHYNGKCWYLYLR